MTYTLQSLLSQVTRSYLANIGDEFSLESLADWPHIYEHTYFLGPLNTHLATPRNPRSRHPEARSTPLDPNTAVSGQCLLLTWLNHDGYFWLEECGSREELAERICCGGGVCNAWIGFQAVWEDGKILPYRVHYTDWQGTRKVLDKSRPDPVPSEDSGLESHEPQAVEIEWLEGQ